MRASAARRSPWRGGLLLAPAALGLLLCAQSTFAEEKPDESESSIEIEASDAMQLAWATFRTATDDGSPVVLVAVDSGEHDLKVHLMAPPEVKLPGPYYFQVSAPTWLMQIPCVASNCEIRGRWQVEGRNEGELAYVDIQARSLRERRRRVRSTALSLPEEQLILKANGVESRIVPALDGGEPPDAEAGARGLTTVGPRTAELRRSDGAIRATDAVSCDQCFGFRVAGLTRDEVLRVLFNINGAVDWMVLRVQITASPAGPGAPTLDETRYDLFVEAVYVGKKPLQD